MRYEFENLTVMINKNWMFSSPFYIALMPLLIGHQISCGSKSPLIMSIVYWTSVVIICFGLVVKLTPTEIREIYLYYGYDRVGIIHAYRHRRYRRGILKEKIEVAKLRKLVEENLKSYLSGCKDAKDPFLFYKKTLRTLGWESQWSTIEFQYIFAFYTKVINDEFKLKSDEEKSALRYPHSIFKNLHDKCFICGVKFNKNDRVFRDFNQHFYTLFHFTCFVRQMNPAIYGQSGTWDPIARFKYEVERRVEDLQKKDPSLNPDV